MTEDSSKGKIIYGSPEDYDLVSPTVTGGTESPETESDLPPGTVVVPMSGPAGPSGRFVEDAPIPTVSAGVTDEGPYADGTVPVEGQLSPEYVQYASPQSIKEMRARQEERHRQLMRELEPKPVKAIRRLFKRFGKSEEGAVTFDIDSAITERFAKMDVPAHDGPDRPIAMLADEGRMGEARQRFFRLYPWADEGYFISYLDATSGMKDQNL